MSGRGETEGRVLLPDDPVSAIFAEDLLMDLPLSAEIPVVGSVECAESSVLANKRPREDIKIGRVLAQFPFGSVTDAIGTNTEGANEHTRRGYVLGKLLTGWVE